MAYRRRKTRYGRRRRFRRKYGGRGYRGYKRTLNRKVIKNKGYGALGAIGRAGARGAWTAAGMLAGSVLRRYIARASNQLVPLGSAYTNKEVKKTESYWSLTDMQVMGGSVANMQYVSLNALEQGIGKNQRIGRSVRFLRAQIRFRVTNSGTETGNVGLKDGQKFEVYLLNYQRAQNTEPGVNAFYVNDQNRLSRRHWGSDDSVDDNVINNIFILKKKTFWLDAHTDDRIMNFARDFYWDVPLSIVSKYDESENNKPAWNHILMACRTFRADGNGYAIGVTEPPAWRAEYSLSYIDD